MPYIQDIDHVDAQLQSVLDARSVGELTYMLTRAINDYRYTHGLTFQTIAEIIGALECTKTEFYRRIVTPYEDKKLAENGDVYGLP